jgi:hypothetical protein
VTSQKAQKNKDFLNFYKYYQERLIAEHPRWTNSQISTIIKLLWRKKISKRTRRNSITSKGLTGRQLYNRSKLKEGLAK